MELWIWFLVCMMFGQDVTTVASLRMIHGLVGELAGVAGIWKGTFGTFPGKGRFDEVRRLWQSWKPCWNLSLIPLSSEPNFKAIKRVVLELSCTQSCVFPAFWQKQFKYNVSVGLPCKSSLDFFHKLISALKRHLTTLHLWNFLRRIFCSITWIHFQVSSSSQTQVRAPVRYGQGLNT